MNCICIYIWGKETSWESGSLPTLGGWSRVKVRGVLPWSPCVGGKSHPWFFIPGRALLSVIPGFSPLSPLRPGKSRVQPGPWEERAELPSAILSWPLWGHLPDPVSLPCRPCPWPGRRRESGWFPGSRSNLSSAGACVLQTAFTRHGGGAAMRHLLIDSPTDAEGRCGSGAGGRTALLGLSVTPCLSRGDWTVCAVTASLFVCSHSCAWGWSDSPALTLPGVTSLSNALEEI